jgi:hypothetical protein
MENENTRQEPERLYAVSEDHVLIVAQNSRYHGANHETRSYVHSRGCLPLVQPEHRHLYER